MQRPLHPLLLILLLAFLPLGAARAQQKEGGRPTAKERLAQKKEGLRKRRDELKWRAMQRKTELEEKARLKKEELREKSEAARLRADSVLDVRNSRIVTDTLYVARPQSNWIFRAKTDMTGENLHLHTGPESGYTSDYHLLSDPKVTLGMMANYRGVSLSLSLSPTKLLSDISDMVSAINYYNNTFGADVTLERIDAFRGRTGLTSSSRKLSSTSLLSFQASAYYVFNGRRFSYPAVFNSTWVQKRSAGSFLAQATFSTGRLKIGDPLEHAAHYENTLNRISMNYLSVGAGYAYNFVAGRHWLVHLTAQPSAMLWKNYKLHTLTPQGQDEGNKMETNHINVFVVGRVGAIYSWDKYFVGMTGVVQTAKTGKSSDFTLTRTTWKGRAFFGWTL